MSKLSPALSSGLVFLAWIFCDPAQAQRCPNVDAAASQPLRAVSLPPSPQDKCSIKLNNGYPVPDPTCTPGAINPTATLEVLVSPRYRTSCLMNNRITVNQKATTYDWYNISQPKDNVGPNQTCQLDHLVPLELGGADTLDNIWPLCGPPGVRLAQRYFAQKTLVNNYLIMQVRMGLIPLADAQRGIASDWTQYLDDAYPHYVHKTAYINRTDQKPPTSDPNLVGLLFASTRAIQRIPPPVVAGLRPGAVIYQTKTKDTPARPVEPEIELVPTNERSQQLSFGTAQVHVPEERTAGQVQRPWQIDLFGFTLYRQTENDKKHFTIKSTSWLSQDEFINNISASGINEAIIFVHGFNTSFDDGLYRLAQIVWDTKFTGLPILFSWPSKGELLAYEYDRESTDFSASGFRELIKILQQNTELSTIHVIAHSMGNQAVLGALANAGTEITQKGLGQLVFAAPDVDRDVFKLLEPKIAGFRGATLYASSADKALQLSKTIAQGPRAGDIPSPPDTPIILPNMDTIDATAIGDELFGLNHTIFASSRDAIADIARLLRGERPPNVRSPLIIPVPPTGTVLFWRYAY
jgi:esterase/lipase superfamily enzyme